MPLNSLRNPGVQAALAGELSARAASRITAEQIAGLEENLAQYREASGQSSIADLEAKRDKAAAAGNDRKVAEHQAAIEARQSWLTEAQRALDEFSA